MNRNLLFAVIVGTFLALVVTGGAEALSTPMPELRDSAVVTCTTSPTLIAPDSTNAVGSMCIQNPSAAAVYLGGKTVTTTTGLVVAAGTATAPTSFCFDAQRTYCIVAAATSDVRVGYGLRQ